MILASSPPSSRCPPLRHECCLFLALIISLLPNLGARAVNLLALVAMVFVALYLFLSRGLGDYLVRATQMAVIGFIFPNASAVVKEF